MPELSYGSDVVQVGGSWMEAPSHLIWEDGLGKQWDPSGLQGVKAEKSGAEAEQQQEENAVSAAQQDSSLLSTGTSEEARKVPTGG